MNKISKTLMHVWISTVSLAAFVFSWIIMAHSPKPSTSSAQAEPTPQISQAAASVLPVLEPLPTLENYLQSGSSQPQIQTLRKSPTIVQPRLRTRGS